MTARENTGGEYFIFLDGLRGVAALSVVMLHWLDGNGRSLFGAGVLAVDFFFLLSGFVIAHAYQDRLVDGLSRARFYVTRVIRLWPMIALGTLLGGARFFMKGIVEHDRGIALETAWRALLTVALIPTDHRRIVDLFPLNGPLWSLHFEVLAYLFFGLWMFRAKTASLLGLVVVSAAYYVWSESAAHGLADGYLLGLSRIACSFSLGVVIFRCRERFADVRLRSGVWLALPMLVLFALPRSFVSAWAAILVITLAFPYVILSGSRVVLPRRAANVMRFLGQLSYPLYVLHVPLMWTMSRSLISVGVASESTIIWWGAFIIPCLAACAYLAFWLYDEPVRRWLKSRWIARSRIRNPEIIRAPG